MGGQFVDVGSSSDSTISLNSLVAQGDSIDGCVSLSTIDTFGYTASTYVWADWGETEVGWVDDNMEFVTDVTIAPGTAFWVQADVDGVTLQSSGAVEKSDVTITYDNSGYSLASNPYPTSVLMSEIIALGEGLDGCISLSIIDDQGYTEATYVWADWGGDDVGWVDDNMEFVTDATIGAGQGFWVQVDVDSASLRFPAIEL